MTVNESISVPVPHIERAVSDAAIQTRPRKQGSAGADDGMLGLGLIAGPANVIMQLASPGVGYGVMESRVERGRVDRHPIKRARTTFTYLAVSTNGTDQQKAAFRRAVDGAHAQVYSTRGEPGRVQRLRQRPSAVGRSLHVPGHRRCAPPVGR